MNDADKALYSKYFSLVKANDIKKEEKFDFNSGIFGISIPLDSPGYTFAIILSLIAIVFNFV